MSSPAAGESDRQSAAKRRVAAGSALASLLLTAAKLVVGLLSGSLAILSDALHSLLDLVAALITWWVVGISGQPPDADHPYGHGRAEQLGALAEVILLAVTATLILRSAVVGLLDQPEIPRLSAWPFLVLGLGIAVDLGRSTRLRRAARNYHSAALAADAVNFTSDLFSALLVIAALALIALGPALRIPSWLLGRLDPLAAVVVALQAFWSALRLAWRTTASLMDRVPSELTRQLAQAVDQVPGVLPGSVRLRARLIGEVPYVDVSLEVERAVSLEGAQSVVRAVEQAIVKAYPGADVVVAAHPGRSELELHRQAVLAAAHRQALEVHHVDVLLLQQGLEVDVDLELPPELSLQAAHAQSEAFERELRGVLPGVVRIGVHLEPRTEAARPAVRHPETVNQVRRVLEGLVPAGRLVRVDAALTSEGAVVHVYLRFKAADPLQRVHEEMTALERALRREVPELDQVYIDPEPVDA